MRLVSNLGPISCSSCCRSLSSPPSQATTAVTAAHALARLKATTTPTIRGVVM
ncbi:unnamed protein product [Ectocarpus sp. 13 AM-2016]